MINGIQGLYHLKATNPDKALEAACREFESIFAHQLLKVMGESMPDGLFGESHASDIYKDMLFQSVGEAVASSGALGIGSVLKGHMQLLKADSGDSKE